MNDDLPSGHHPPLENSGEAESFPDDVFSDQPQTTRKLQLLSVGSLVLGVFEDEIATIAEWRKPTPLPHGPPAVLGVVSIQGRMLIVLDLLPLLGGTANSDSASRGFLVALRGDEQIALAVEEQAETLELTTTELQPPSEPASSAVYATFSYRDQLINVIDVKGLFPSVLQERQRRRRRF
jgi:purine-binding chemotaxis protein CheW